MLQKIDRKSTRLKLIKVEYEEYPVEIHPRKSMYGSNPPIHFDKKDNVLARSNYFIGDVDKGMEQAETIVKGTYKTPIVQHCHIENPISYAYMEKGRIVVVTSTQIPHIVRRVIGQALGMCELLSHISGEDSAINRMYFMSH